MPTVQKESNIGSVSVLTRSPFPRSPAQTAAATREPFVMTEHPAWRPAREGFLRLFDLGSTPVVITVSEHGRVIDPPPTGFSIPQDLFWIDAEDVPSARELGNAVSALGPVLRYRNPDLWDAIATGIIRQVIRASQSKRLYRLFADRYGRPAEHRGVSCAPFPDPVTVLALDDDAFTDTGLAFKRRPLRHAAQAYLHHAEEWRTLRPADLVVKLQSVRGIGPWTARAAVADYSNDWSLYPYGDLAVRTWARRAAPTTNWPDDEAVFADRWSELAGMSVSALTLGILAWGSRHGDIG
jgi:DNA-3-methyladenine glycosylase II